MTGKTLLETLPREFGDSEFNDTRAFKFKDVEVIKTHYTWSDKPEDGWIGKHKNVRVWYELANGYAVGFNENPSVGWAFPVVNMNRKKKTDKMTIQEWLDNIDDNEMHYIGEYYTYLTGKLSRKKDASPTIGFLRWWKVNESQRLNLDGFIVYSSKWVAFFFKKKKYVSQRRKQ